MWAIKLPTTVYLLDFVKVQLFVVPVSETVVFGFVATIVLSGHYKAVRQTDLARSEKEREYGSNVQREAGTNKI